LKEDEWTRISAKIEEVSLNKSKYEQWEQGIRARNWDATVSLTQPESLTLRVLKLVRRQLLSFDFVENSGARKAAAREGRSEPSVSDGKFEDGGFSD